MAVKSLKRSSVKSTQKTNAMNAGYNFQDFELIESVFLASAASNVTFSNLQNYATDYKHLQIRYTARTARTEINDGIAIRINGDSGSNYAAHYLYGTGSSALSGGFSSATSTFNSPIAGNTATSNAFAGGTIDITDAFSSTKNTTLRGLGGVASNFNQIMLCSGLWNSVASITSLAVITTTGNNYISGSRFSLYGIR
jgi:hypothetical protein